jgi:hypothetical protein
VGRAAAVLATERRRAVAFTALLAALALYYFAHRHLPDVGGTWDVAFLALALIPAVFALVGLALPLRRWQWSWAAGLVAAAVAVVAELLALDVLGFGAKLAAMALLGFWFLGLFEALWWAVLVACVVPLVDAYSVWRGPTKHIVEEREEVFVTLSLGFPVWGDEGTANLGLPDLFFFAIFLAAAARWRLRVFWTWLAMALSFGATLAIAVEWDVGGLPALPILCVAFLLPNLDLIWRDLRGRR